MRVYFDTEYCSLWRPMPISIGFAADSGETLYLEVWHDPSRRSKWVEDNVVPHLTAEGQLGNGHSPACATIETLLWLKRFEDNQYINLVCDFIGDYWILDALTQGATRAVCTPRHAAGVRDAFIELWFKEHPDLPRHHALNDAMALRSLEPALSVT